MTCNHAEFEGTDATASEPSRISGEYLPGSDTMTEQIKARSSLDIHLKEKLPKRTRGSQITHFLTAELSDSQVHQRQLLCSLRKMILIDQRHEYGSCSTVIVDYKLSSLKYSSYPAEKMQDTDDELCKYVWRCKALSSNSQYTLSAKFSPKILMTQLEFA